MNKQSLSRRTLLRGLGATAGALLLPGCQTGGRTLSSRDVQLFQPRGLHLSLPGDVRRERAVTWFTDGLEAPPSLLEFDTVTPEMSAGDIQTLALGNRVEASHEPTIGVDAFTHRARLEAPDPDLPLRYRVGSAAGWSPVQVVPPTPADTWRFVHFGDHGINPRTARLIQAVKRESKDLLMLAGDLSYANGDQPIWDDWFDLVEPVLAGCPTMAVPGNHEAKDFDGDAFKNRFTHPAPRTALTTGSPAGNTFYSFEFDRVHFLCTTAGALINDGTLPEEIANIELDLALAAARRAAGQIDFIVVMQHYPIWTDQAGRSPANPTLVALEENIIVRYGVDLLLVGHDHVYQRSVPMAFGLPNPLGYVQMMVGTGGQSVRLFDDNGPQAWSARQFIGLGYARYEVKDRVIRGQYLGAPPRDLDQGLQLIDEDLRVLDEFEFRARPRALARAFALPPREPAILLADFDAISRHTRQRNRQALAHCA